MTKEIEEALVWADSTNDALLCDAGKLNKALRTLAAAYRAEKSETAKLRDLLSNDKVKRVMLDLRTNDQLIVTASDEDSELVIAGMMLEVLRPLVKLVKQDNAALSAPPAREGE